MSPFIREVDAIASPLLMLRVVIKMLMMIRCVEITRRLLLLLLVVVVTRTEVARGQRSKVAGCGKLGHLRRRI